MRTKAISILLGNGSSGFETPAQGTAFNDQGLNENGGPATGVYGLRFGAYVSPIAPSSVGGPITIPGVFVINGLFAVRIDLPISPFTPEFVDINKPNLAAVSLRVNNPIGDR